MLKFYQKPFVQEIKEDWILDKGLQLFIKREDVIHPFVSGNKWRKIKYNLAAATEQQHDTLLTFGGAYSNHIYATAAAAHEAGFKAIGIIRGEELANKPLNQTLAFAREKGMHLHFVNRSDYRQKNDPAFIKKLNQQHGHFYLLPEGGTNSLAIKGCEEILDTETVLYDTICLAVGTGGTISGVISAATQKQDVIGVSVLKGDFLMEEVRQLLLNYKPWPEGNPNRWEIATEYHFGGYAKVNDRLVQFIEAFEAKHDIPLDPIYTGKMMYAVYDMIKKNRFKKGKKILTIHTGGLQGKNH